MKQCITFKQLEEVNSEILVPLLKNKILSKKGHYLIKEPYMAKQLTIGKMIEILESQSYKNKSNIDFYIASLTYDCIDGYLILVTGYIDGAIGHEVVFSLKTHKYNKCDALFEAIKEVLNV